jgi:hypothetical protein
LSFFSFFDFFFFSVDLDSTGAAALDGVSTAAVSTTSFLSFLDFFFFSVDFSTTAGTDSTGLDGVSDFLAFFFFSDVGAFSSTFRFDTTGSATSKY